MICLSKADETFYRHLSWNQSPSPLAATHTTRQDLNGISNLREHVDAGQDDGSGGGNGGLLGVCDDSGQLGNPSSEPRKGSADDAGRLSRVAGLSSCLKTVDGGDDQIRLPRGTFSSCASHIWSWAVWALSVLVVSTVLTSWKSSSPAATTLPSPGAHESLDPVRVSPLRKRNTCEKGGVDKDDYNLPLHVGALFIVLFVSSLACAFPVLATKFPGLRIPSRFFFAVRHFGTGVLIATAFVHLLPTAFISLGDPCLSSFWNEDYPAMPGAISLAAIFFVTIIEMVFHPSRHVPPVEITSNRAGESNAHPSNGRGCMGSVGMLPIRDMGPLRGRSSSIGQGLSVLNSRDGRLENLEEEACEDETNNRSGPKQDPEETSLEALEMPTLSPEQQQRKELLQCVLLELGILFHSVFIGMALSVSIGNEFIILLIAIVFHQTFEGLALGSRIAAIKWPKGKMQPWFMALAYGCTTPIGQAIGLATHNLYSPGSEIGLIVVGVMNAISAGLLTFASLVELLSEDFLSDESWRFLRGRKRVYACLLVFFGAFFMSLVGAWA
ncbi:hypothetical protein ACJ41O_001833 [Fusarium nematophilum]